MDLAGLVASGQQIDGGFNGLRLQFDRSGEIALQDQRHPPGAGLKTPLGKFASGEWTPIEVRSNSEGLKISIKGEPLYTEARSAGEPRTVFAFTVDGAGTEFRIKDLHLELPPGK